MAKVMNKEEREFRLEVIGRAYYHGKADEVYAESDGYGVKGLIPPQGMDWSGIRDSSDEAVMRMYRIAIRQ